jgi:hypothetical protein
VLTDLVRFLGTQPRVSQPSCGWGEDTLPHEQRQHLRVLALRPWWVYHASSSALVLLLAEYRRAQDTVQSVAAEGRWMEVVVEADDLLA